MHHRPPTRHHQLPLVATLAAAALFIQPTLRASSYTVSSKADTGAGSLRQAILDLNAGGGSSNTITA